MCIGAGFGGCIFRFLVQYTEEAKRVRSGSVGGCSRAALVVLHTQLTLNTPSLLLLQILCLQLLVLLAEDDADAVVRACQVAAQGQRWQPNMFIYTLQKRHSGNDRLCALAAELLESFSERMPITSPIQLGSPRAASPGSRGGSAGQQESFVIQDNESRRGEFASLAAAQRKPHTLPALGSPKRAPGASSPVRTPHSPTTTISHLYIEAPSPYAPHMRLPISRPPTSPLEQSRRSRIFSTPKLAAVEGDTHRRCQTPNAKGLGRTNHFQLETLNGDASADSDPQAQRLRSLDPFAASPPKSPDDGESPKKRAVVLSEKYSWNPECINSVSGFEWWWRSLPQNHASLEPTQKLKMVTKAAVRLHTKGDWQRAIELYLLSLSMEINEEVEFRLRINLACAYEAAQELAASAEAFRAALKLNPTDPYAQFKLGEVLSAAGDFVEARKLFEAVVDAYPQAADALKKLQQAEEQKLQEDEERRAATAKAKLRRSSPRQSRQDVCVQPNESFMRPAAPAAPSSPVASRRAPEKSKKVALSKDRTALGAAAPVAPSAVGSTDPVDSYQPDRSPSDATADRPPSARADEDGSAGVADPSSLAAHPDASVCSVAVMTEVSTASVATTTDEELEPRSPSSSPKLDHRLMQIGVHQRGLIRLESVADMWRILCGDSPRASDGSSGDPLAAELQRIFAADCKREGEQTLVRYQRILAAFEAHVFARHLAETCADEWMRAGADRVLNSCLRAPRPSDPEETPSSMLTPDLVVEEGPRGTDIEEQTVPAPGVSSCTQIPPAQHGDANVDGGDESSDTVGGTSLPQREADSDRLDGYTALPPRPNTKRERARREQILLREKSRIFARKHLHCLRSLHDLALRARAHHAAQREAVLELTQLAREARVARDIRSSSSSSVVGGAAALATTVNEAEPATSNFKGPRDEPLAHTPTARQELIASASHALWGAALKSATRRVVLAGELRALQALAQRFAAFSSASVGLPLLLASRETVDERALEVRGSTSEEDHLM